MSPVIHMWSFADFQQYNGQELGASDYFTHITQEQIKPLCEIYSRTNNGPSEIRSVPEVEGAFGNTIRPTDTWP